MIKTSSIATQASLDADAQSANRAQTSLKMLVTFGVNTPDPVQTARGIKGRSYLSPRPLHQGSRHSVLHTISFDL
jgi:hypothetical protein